MPVKVETMFQRINQTNRFQQLWSELMTCAYDRDEKTKAVKNCSICGLPMCSSCGFRHEEVVYCNHCYDEMLNL